MRQQAGSGTKRALRGPDRRRLLGRAARLAGTAVLGGCCVWAVVATGGAQAAPASEGPGPAAGLNPDVQPAGLPEPGAASAAEAVIEVQSAGLRLASDAESYLLHADLQIGLNATLTEAVAKGIALYFVLECEILRPRWYWTDERLVVRERVYRLAFHALTRQYRLQIVQGASASTASPAGAPAQGGGAQGGATQGGSTQGGWLSWIWGGSGAAGASGGGGAAGSSSSPGSAGAAGSGGGSTTGGSSLLVQSYASLREALLALGRVRGLRVLEAGRLQPGQAYELRVRMRLDAAMLPRPFQVPGIAQRDWSVESPWKRFSFEIETRKSAP